MGLFLDRLEERGELENTIVIYASDHGEMLGDHDLWKKAQPYHPSVGIPLIVAGPGIRSQEPTDALVNLIDVPVTLLDYAGVPVPESFDGRSLRPVLEGEQSTYRGHIYSGLNNWRMAFDGRYKLITDWDEEMVLFDLGTDEEERNNVANRNPSVVDRLSEVIARRR